MNLNSKERHAQTHTNYLYYLKHDERFLLWKKTSIITTKKMNSVSPPFMLLLSTCKTRDMNIPNKIQNVFFFAGWR